jgi:hypothetical protein
MILNGLSYHTRNYEWFCIAFTSVGKYDQTVCRANAHANLEEARQLLKNAEEVRRLDLRQMWNTSSTGFIDHKFFVFLIGDCPGQLSASHL